MYSETFQEMWQIGIISIKQLHQKSEIETYIIISNIIIKCLSLLVNKKHVYYNIEI